MSDKTNVANLEGAESGRLYRYTKALMTELGKVQRGRGDEKKLERAVDDLYDAGGNPQAVAALIASAGRAAAEAANACRDCAAHAMSAAQMTMDDYGGPKRSAEARHKAKTKAREAEAQDDAAE